MAFRRHTLLPLDDCLHALQPQVSRLTRSALYRCLQRHGISRLPDVGGTFRDIAAQRTALQRTSRSVGSSNGEPRPPSVRGRWRADRVLPHPLPPSRDHASHDPAGQRDRRLRSNPPRGGIAEVQTFEGKLHLFAGIDRTRKFAVTQLVEKADSKTAWEFLQHMPEAVPCQVHTILTPSRDISCGHTLPGKGRGHPVRRAAPEPHHRLLPADALRHDPRRRDHVRSPADAPSVRAPPATVRGRRSSGIEPRPTKPNHPRTDGRVERTRRTIREGEARSRSGGSATAGREALPLMAATIRCAPTSPTSADAYDFARRPQTLVGLTPCEYVCRDLDIRAGSDSSPIRSTRCRG